MKLLISISQTFGFLDLDISVFYLFFYLADHIAGFFFFLVYVFQLTIQLIAS